MSKRVIFPLFLLITSSVFVSCADRSGPSLAPNVPTPKPVEQSDLKLDTSKIKLRMDNQGSFSIKVSSKTGFKYVIISNNGNWVTPQDTRDNTNYSKGKDVEVKFNYDINYTAENRTALLLFKSPNTSQYTDTVYVSQSKTLYIDVKHAGSLSDTISKRKLDLFKIKNLTLTGELNGLDLYCLRRMAGCGKNVKELTRGQLANLDISNINFKQDNNNVYFINIDSHDQHYTINDTKLFPDFAFTYCTSLKRIKIPNNITEIGEEAFSNCISLTSANIPNGVKKIKKQAFKYCQLYNIDIPDKVTNIGPEAFSGCLLLERVNLPNKMDTINYKAFAGCVSLKKIKLPEGLTQIYQSLCVNCSSLTSVIIPSTVKVIGNGAFDRCASLDSVVINIKEISSHLIANSSRPFKLESNAILYIPNSPKELLDVYKKQEFGFTTYFKNRIERQK